MDKLPRGIELVAEALADATPVQVNAGRAVSVVYWKGLLNGLRLAERMGVPPKVRP